MYRSRVVNDPHWRYAMFFVVTFAYSPMLFLDHLEAFGQNGGEWLRGAVMGRSNIALFAVWFLMHLRIPVEVRQLLRNLIRFDLQSSFHEL